MKKILELKLKILAKLILWRQKPKVIGISGSVGKTSAKTAIYQVLKNKYRVSGGIKNYNNEIGLPLSIIGKESPKKNVLAWILLFFKAFCLILFKSKKYPQILILEMGVDRPGDMKYLCNISQPTIAVITAVGHSHIQYFGSKQKIKEEKQNLVKSLPANGLAILNCDDDLVCQMSDVARCKVLKYGFLEKNDLIAQDLKYNLEMGNYEISGLSFKFNHNGSIVPVVMDNVICKTAVYSALVAAAVGLYFDINLVDIAASLKSFSLPAGRMNVIAGKNHSFIIDDSYNSSPESANLALELFSKIRVENDAKKYLVIGDILEIGSYTEDVHRELGKKIAKMDIDFLLCVGRSSKYIAKEAESKGLGKKKIFLFDKPEEAGLFLEENISAGDIILFKASRGIKMERAIKKIMLEEDKSTELLVS